MSCPEPVLLHVHSFPKKNALLPAEYSIDVFDKILLNAQRAVVEQATWGSMEPHHSQPFGIVKNFLEQMISNVQEFKPTHVQDFTGQSVTVNIAVRQMFWMHQIRMKLKESKYKFSSTNPYATLPWLIAKQGSLISNTGTGPATARTFIHSWRAVLTTA
jgi:hypothetical protein